MQKGGVTGESKYFGQVWWNQSFV